MLIRQRVAISFVILLAGCSPADGSSLPPMDTSPSVALTAVPSSLPSPSASVVPSAPASYPADLPTGDVESAAIIEGWQAYWRVFEKFSADPSLPDLTETQYVTTGEASDTMLKELRYGRDKNLKSVGIQQFRDVRLSSIWHSADGREADIEYCADMSAARLIDVDTGNLVDRGISDTFRETATMREGADGIWRVAKMRNMEAQC